MTGIDPRIRPATPDEAAALAAVYRSAYRQNRGLGFPAKAEAATAEEVADWIREHRVFAAKIDAGSIGEDIVGGVRTEVTDPDRLKLSRLAVHADWKGKGIGSRLVSWAESVARVEDRKAIWLTTPEGHPFLPEFYRDRGYEEVEEYPLEYRDYDEIVLEKRFPEQQR